MNRLQSRHIAFVLPDLKLGGLQLVVVNLLIELSKKNLRLDVLVASQEGELIDRIPDNVRLFTLDENIEHRLKGASRLIFPLSKYLKDEKPNVVFSQIWLFNVVSVIAKLISMSSSKVILVEHASFGIAYKNKIGPSHFAEYLLPFLRRILYPLSDGVIAVSNKLSEDVAKNTGLSVTAVKTIYNPIIPENILERSLELTGHPWFENAGIPIVLCVGRLAPEKDFSTVIHAFADVISCHQARLVILGEGSERRNLEQLTQNLDLTDHVSMPGFVSNPYAYMSRASVFVLSSLSEALGNVLIEALAVGTPVISTDCPTGPREILGDGKYGHLVRVGDREQMAETIIEILKKGNSKKVSASWLKKFEFQTVVEQYIKIASD